MKVTAFVGSARKKHTYNVTRQFLDNLQSFGNVETELVSLCDYHLGVCKGCKLCLDKGEELCPMKDDRDLLIEKMMTSDGVIFASPNYSFSVSGQMKIFLDRLGFIFHRPRFFGKAYTGMVVQGVYYGNKIVSYFNFIGKSLGFNIIKGCCLNSFEPMTAKEKKQRDRIIEKQSKKFYATLIKREFPVPNLFQLMVFRMSRTSIRLILNESWKDYRYYNENGWFESDYYYPVKLNPLKRIVAKSFDFIFSRIYRKKVTGEQFQPA